MTTLYGQGSNTLIAALVVFFLLSVGQALRVVAVACWREEKPLAASVVHELFVLCHLVLFTMALNAAAHEWDLLVVGFGLSYVPVEPLFWVNALAFAAGLALMLFARRPLIVFDLMFFAASTPWAIGLMGDYFSMFLFIDMVFFAFRVFSGTAFDVNNMRHSVSRFATIEAMKLLPEGVVCADRRGRVLFMNDSMRSCLRALGLPTDLADMSELPKMLEACAFDKGDPGESPDSTPSLDEGIRISVPGKGTWLFAGDELVLGLTFARRIVSFDITEEYQVECELEAANKRLEAAGVELRTWVEHVQESAENEALLHMRARVHDVIGQRLSLLHRCLEDGDVTNEQLASMRPVLTDILGDLASFDKVDCEVKLESILKAFRLVGVEIHLNGVLPKDDCAAEIAVNVIRETATNAVRHAHAQHVWVDLLSEDNSGRQNRFEGRNCPGVQGGADAQTGSRAQGGLRGKGCFCVTVRNDGDCCTEVLRAGTGMRGMRHAAEEVGGTFDFHCGPPFTVEVAIPLPCEHVAHESWSAKQGSGEPPNSAVSAVTHENWNANGEGTS